MATYQERQTFGNGKLVINSPTKDDNEREKTYTFHAPYTIEDILTIFPELARVAVTVESLTVGGEVWFDADLTEIEPIEEYWKALTLWSLSLRPTMTSSTGLKFPYSNPDAINHIALRKLLWDIGQDETNQLWVTSIMHSDNAYGEFIFINFCDKSARCAFQLFGYGEHYSRGEWKYDWSINPQGGVPKNSTPNRQSHNSWLEELFDLMDDIKPGYGRKFEQPPYVAVVKSAQQKAFSFLVDELGDEDSITTELQDNPNIIDGFEGDD